VPVACDRWTVWTVSIALLSGQSVAMAATVSIEEDVPIVGGTAAFAQSLGISPPPDAPRFIAELVRLIYNVPEGKTPDVDAKVQNLAARLELARKFQTSLAAIQPADGAITLAMAEQKGPRDRLQSLLELIGLKLRETNKRYFVEQTDHKQSAQRVWLLEALGIDLDQLQMQLNAGQAPSSRTHWSPQDIHFDAEVIVHQLVTQTRDALPLDLRIRTCQRGRKVFSPPRRGFRCCELQRLASWNRRETDRT
jgi:hypothetical protein